MPGFIGKILISLSFFITTLSLMFYFVAAQKDSERHLKVGNWLFAIKGVLILVASGILLDLLITHQFQYYYVFNYTSLDLDLKYLISAFYGGQEGSFLLWILFSWLAGFSLMKWTRAPYKAPVMFFLALTQFFLLTMVLGWKLDGISIGASPFRTIAEEMPNAPFIQANPDFVPADGSGLNDLLKSPWMMIHPPILFLGFASMTIPYAFAMAALWKQKYNEWVAPALPWTLAANLALLIAIFLGAYWAYVTLSFGGYWAWDPVENASLVPWLIGTAGIHAMAIQRKSSVAQKSSLLFAILAYVAIVYETFLTRSGILSDSSVHSFVDLGLYNQLLLFMVIITGVGLGFFAWRYKELPSKPLEPSILNREFMTFSGALLLFILGVVIILGTSSPIIGLLFHENPTPPEISFYNDWSMPIAIVMALITVIGQFVYWKKQNSESLSSSLTLPLLVTSVLTVGSIMWMNVRDIYYMIYLFSGYFAIIGNGWMMVKLAIKNPKVIGGSLTHVGFGMLLVGILYSSAYNEPVLDQNTVNYNNAVLRGEVNDEQGFKVSQTVEMMELKLDEPKLVNGRYEITYEGYDLMNQNRPGQQTYTIKFNDLKTGREFYMYPEVYPMLSGSSAENIQWSVDPDVKAGLLKDIYLYVAGSSFIDQTNKQKAKEQEATTEAVADTEEPLEQTIRMRKGETIEVGGFEFTFTNFIMADSTSMPDNQGVGVRARVEVLHTASQRKHIIEPLFAVYVEDEVSYTKSYPVTIPDYDISFRFSNLNPDDSTVELTIVGLDEKFEDDWILIVGENKPFISVVWLGTFLLMGGFSISIFRHWGRERAKA
ncbi:MAG TPA: hypothetical protein DEQ34_03135 [Balneolaceae bacterium]|nr:hypothetical protein [Balneolaceae bacterium]|tara:strand:- start:61093 stop:63573 length:2481 start_codon:yes stop_codon:yes gene_type:complete